MKSVPLSQSMASIVLLLTLSACGSTGADYQPIVDGDANTEQYRADLAACQDVADRRSYLNDDVLNEALLGAALGTALGGLADGVGGAVAGAGIGGAVGAGGRAWDTMDERKQIVIACMKGRGHRVVG